LNPEIDRFRAGSDMDEVVGLLAGLHKCNECKWFGVNYLRPDEKLQNHSKRLAQCFNQEKMNLVFPSSRKYRNCEYFQAQKYETKNGIIEEKNAI
jgi:hypothetical protein